MPTLKHLLEERQEQVPVSSRQLNRLRQRVLKNHPMLEASRSSAAGWFRLLLPMGAAVALLIMVTILTPSVSPVAPKTTFASAFDRTFGKSLTEFFFSMPTEGVRHTSWSVTFGDQHNTIDIWTDGHSTRVTDAYAEPGDIMDGVTADMLKTEQEMCVILSGMGAKETPPAPDNADCHTKEEYVEEAKKNVEKFFLAPSMETTFTVTKADDPEYHVTGFVISWQTSKPYLMDESDSSADNVMIEYAEGARSFGEENLADTFNSSLDVINQPVGDNYEHHLFMGVSMASMELGAAFQLIENDQASQMMLYEPTTQSLQETDRAAVAQRFAQQAYQTENPLGERIFAPLYFAAWTNGYEVPLKNEEVFLDGHKVRYYEFNGTNTMDVSAYMWKKRENFGGEAPILRFWIDEAQQKIVQFAIAYPMHPISEGGEPVRTTYQVTTVKLLVDEVLSTAPDFMTMEGWRMVH